jgi:hypothetical protein
LIIVRVNYRPPQNETAYAPQSYLTIRLLFSYALFMGRTVPTYIDQVRELEARWSKFRRALRRDDRLHFDRLLRSVRQYSPSGVCQNSDDVRESVALSILLDLQKRLAVIVAKLAVQDVEESTTAELVFPENVD